MSDLATIQAMLATLLAGNAAPLPTENDAPIASAKQFASLGFVVVGDGADPGEGVTLSVPTKAGKVARVLTQRRIDTSPFQGEFATWAYTYRRLRK